MLDDRTQHYRISDQNRRLSFASVINYWQTSAAFRQFYNRLLAESPFPAGSLEVFKGPGETVRFRNQFPVDLHGGIGIAKQFLGFS